MEINIENVGSIAYPRFICVEFRVPTFFKRDLMFISEEKDYVNRINKKIWI